jgi:xanthine phosphoribosyltransferase
MEKLKELIRKEGIVISDQILKVDSFLNHQIDPVLMYEIGETFAEMYRDRKISKVLTIESSGIAPAIMTGLVLKVPVVFARKQAPSTLSGSFYLSEIFSYTKKKSVPLVVAEAYLRQNDTVLIVDDFLANGEAARGMVDLVRQAGSTLAGIGIVIEKSFQSGGKFLRAKGLQVDSLVQIKSLNDGVIEFVES